MSFPPRKPDPNRTRMDANRLALVAELMDEHLRTENERLASMNNELFSDNCNLAMDLMRSDLRCNDLVEQNADLARVNALLTEENGNYAIAEHDLERNLNFFRAIALRAQSDAENLRHDISIERQMREDAYNDNNVLINILRERFGIRIRRVDGPQSGYVIRQVQRNLMNELMDVSDTESEPESDITLIE